jgi:hypothetical protein
MPGAPLRPADGADSKPARADYKKRPRVHSCDTGLKTRLPNLSWLLTLTVGFDVRRTQWELIC